MYTNDKKVIKSYSLFAILLKLYDFGTVRVMHLLIRNVISYAELSNAFMDSVTPYAQNSRYWRELNGENMKNNVFLFLLMSKIWVISTKFKIHPQFTLDNLY